MVTGLVTMNGNTEPRWEDLVEAEVSFAVVPKVIMGLGMCKLTLRGDREATRLFAALYEYLSSVLFFLA